MIKDSEVKQRTDGSYRVIFYDTEETSSGFVFDKRTLYDLYSKLRDIFKDEQKDN